jgi:DNA mismatch endonuclease (patch repair protein)
MLVRRELHRRGHRYRLHPSWIFGRPDIAFTKARLAIFIDGDFWHGWKFSQWSGKLAPYWASKIARNIRRDRKYTRRLRGEGWKVVRIWEHDVEKNLPRCVARIEAAIRGLEN